MSKEDQVLAIEIKRPYLSLPPQSVELPDFTVIAVRNGSGKSQFLQAIAGRHAVYLFDQNKYGMPKYIAVSDLKPTKFQENHSKELSDYVIEADSDIQR